MSKDIRNPLRGLSFFNFIKKLQYFQLQGVGLKLEIAAVFGVFLLFVLLLFLNRPFQTDFLTAATVQTPVLVNHNGDGGDVDAFLRTDRKAELTANASLSYPVSILEFVWRIS